MQGFQSRTQVSTTSTGTGDLVLGSATDATWAAVGAALDGLDLDVFIEHTTLGENEDGNYRYDHATTTLLRNSTGAVERSTAGLATKETFSAGTKRVSLTVNAPTLRNLVLFRGSGRTLVEDTDWTAGGTFTVSLADPSHRALKIIGVTSGAITQAMTVALPAASGAQWGDEVYVEKAATAGAPAVTVTGPATSYVLKAPGDWAVFKIVGTSTKAWEVRHRGNAETQEDAVSGTLTVNGRLIDRIQRYTGAGHTWTVNTAGRAGIVGIVNAGTGPITVTAGTATIAGLTQIAAGFTGVISYYEGGAKARVIGEEAPRLTTGTTAGTPYTNTLGTSINRLLSSGRDLVASSFNIYPDSTQDETTRILNAVVDLAGEGPSPVTGRKRGIVFSPGTYLIDSLADTTTTPIICRHGTVFQYNGAAGADTFMWKVTIAGGDPRITYGKFLNAKFNGRGPSDLMPESLVWAATSLDWGTFMRGCHLFRAGLYGVRVNGTTNGYFEDMRFDAIGASAIRIENVPTRQNLIVVRLGTCTWNDPANLSHWVSQGYIASGSVGGVVAYWGRAVIELLHQGGSGGGGEVHLADYDVEWHYAGDPAGHGVILDKNASSNVNRQHRLKIDAIRGFTDDTHYIVGFAGTNGLQPVVEASVATLDGAGATPIRDFIRSLSFGNAFATSFSWAGAGQFYRENGGPMQATAANRPAPSAWAKGWGFLATDTGRLSSCDGAAWIDVGSASHQAVTAAAAQASYIITGGRSDILVELTQDLTAGGSVTLPGSPAVGDRVSVVRNGGGFFDLTETVTGTVLGFRNDFVQFRWNGSAWAVVLLLQGGRRPTRRRGTGSYTAALSEAGSDQVFTAAATYTIPLSLGQSTGFNVRLVQRSGSIVTLALGGGLTLVGGPLTTTGDGTALLARAIGNSEVLVTREIVDAASGATDLQPATSAAATVPLGVGDFDNRKTLWLTLDGNQFIQLPAGVPAGKYMHLVWQEGVSGEKVLDWAALSALEAYGITPTDNPQIESPGAMVTLVSRGGDVIKAVGPLQVATASPPPSPTLFDMAGDTILDMAGNPITDMSG